MYPLSLKMSVGFGFLSIWVIVLQSGFQFSRACLRDERSYLLDFRAGLNLSSPHLSSWRGLNCCEWDGVACDYHTSHVIRLDLSADPYGTDYWERTRKLRPSLFKLQHLQHLDLSGNEFIGASIPAQLSKLQRLAFLNLSNAGFCGELPLELGNMSSLRHLDISEIRCLRRNSDGSTEIFHDLKSSKFDVWVRNLRSLEFLGMDKVNLTMASEQWGKALSGLANLTQIHFFDCVLSGNIPHLSNLTRLSHLHIGGNSFPSALPTWFENVSSLVSIDLSECDLNGSIPSNFMPRSKMSIIDLGYNNLKGKLSSFLNHSSSLIELSLSSCNLGEVISPVIENFSKVEILELSNSQLSGQIPPSLCELPALRRLKLYHNELSGTIPVSISMLASLQELSLSYNRLTGNISLQLFDNLTCLHVLDLSENQFQINISTSWIPQFSELEFLGLGSCNIEGEFPPFLSQQYNLFELDLSDNNIVGNIPSWLWELPALDMLNLSNNQLEGSLPRQISHYFHILDLHGNKLYGSLPALVSVSEMLDLSGNEFNGSIPATSDSLSFLSLSANNLTGEIPSSNDLEGLEILDLSKNKLTGMIPAKIGRCSSLLVLNLAQNDLRGEIPEELGNLQALRTLNLNGNRLKGIILPSIANCTALQVFDFGNNKFEGPIPVWIEKLTNLRILSLASNNFKGGIPFQLTRLPNLQILDLSHNHLSGNIPQNLSKLNAMVNQSQSIDVQHIFEDFTYAFQESRHALKFEDQVTVWIKGRAIPYNKIIKADRFMDLSCNNLSGNIPLELGLLKGLISVNISRNNLNGSIPESLGAMDHLESLDLSENKLSGKIPFQLLNLTFLAVLNFSNNMLSGLIPQGKQFSSFDASSFQGNLNLHGPPLENKAVSSSLSNTEYHNNTIDEDVDVMDQWWAVGVGLNYGVGFAIVIAVLCFHIRWRYICFAVMDNLIYDIFKW